MEAAETEHRAADPFVHEALFYRDAAEYVAGTVLFVRAGLDAGEPVLIAVPSANLSLVRDALGDDAERVRLADMTRAGRNPGRIIPHVLHAFLEENRGDRVRVIGEPIWAGRSATEYPACVQHEALINLAFAGRPATILCPYDARGLTESALSDAERTHPVLVDGDVRALSDGYGDPGAVVEAFNQPLPAPPVPAPTLVYNASQLSGVRRFVVEHAGKAGLAPDRLDDFEMAVNEVATNAVAHTPGPGTLRLWSEPGVVVCEISDPGRFTNLLAGRIPPPPSSGGGRGLLLVNHVCDLVRLHAEPTGTKIRLYMNL